MLSCPVLLCVVSVLHHICSNTGFFGTPQTTCQSGTPGGFTALASGCTVTRGKQDQLT